MHNQTKNSKNVLHSRAGRTEKTIRDLEDGTMEITKSEQEKTDKKELLSFYNKRCDTVSQESHKKKENGAGKVHEEIMADNSPNLVKDINPQI